MAITKTFAALALLALAAAGFAAAGTPAANRYVVVSASGCGMDALCP
jgi:hypothetical protein